VHVLHILPSACHIAVKAENLQPYPAVEWRRVRPTGWHSLQTLEEGVPAPAPAERRSCRLPSWSNSFHAGDRRSKSDHSLLRHPFRQIRWCWTAWSRLASRCFLSRLRTKAALPADEVQAHGHWAYLPSKIGLWRSGLK
jgi:hypothetical protein